MSRLTLALALTLTMALPASAFAHAGVKTSSPAADATVSPGPSEIRIRFNEPLELKFCTVQVTGADGKPVAAGDLKPVEGDAASLVLPLSAPAASGSYHVHWSAMGRDGHRTKGGYGFTVK